MELSNINAAYGLCESLYGITPDEDSFEDLALDAWSRIGTKHTRLYQFEGAVKDGVLELPCNTAPGGNIIESVHVPIPDAKTTSNSTNFIWTENIWIEAYIDARSHHSDPYFQKGKLVRYDEGDNELYFSHDYPRVKVVYHGILADDETGLPLVNDKELRAIATFVAYYSLYRESIEKRDANLMKMAQVIKEDWLRTCNAARIPDHLSQNDMDAVFDAKTSWGRKVYGKSLKPIR